MQVKNFIKDVNVLKELKNTDVFFKYDSKGILKEKYTAKELIDAVKAGNIPHENEKIVTWGLYSGINTSSVVIVLES